MDALLLLRFRAGHADKLVRQEDWRAYCDYSFQLSTFPVRPDVQSTNERMEFDVSFSVYDITVPVMVHGLNVMDDDDYLDYAQALERTKGIEPGRILGERLASDMLTFREKFSVSCNKVDAHMAKLMQRDAPGPHNTVMMYPALRERLLRDPRLPAKRAAGRDCRRAVAHVRADAAYRARVVRRRRLHPALGATRLLLPHLDCARDPSAPRSEDRKTRLPRQPHSAERRRLLVRGA